MAKELWDAYDRDGHSLGFDLVRGEPMPEGVWHLVAVVYSVTHDGRVLVTKRAPNKDWGGYWEITGGSVLKGEKPVEGALRELREETGITVAAADLHPVYVQARPGIEGYPSIYHCFVVFFDPAEQAILLQEGETVDYRLMPYEEFTHFIETDAFVPAIARRFLDHREELERIILSHIGKRRK